MLLKKEENNMINLEFSWMLKVNWKHREKNKREESKQLEDENRQWA